MSTLVSARIAALALAAFALAASGSAQKKPKIGYDDTPVLPGQKWRVHDGTRPQPRVVDPGPAPAPAPAPSDAIVLFDGTDLSGWSGRRGDAGWKVENGYMEVNGTGPIHTRQQFGDCQLHVEWSAPAAVKGSSQGRGNSGVFLMNRYEIQVLDCFDNQTYPDGQAGAIYGQWPPLVNASRPPGEWQTYDIIFKAPRFEAGKLVSPAYVTVLHNGVLLHHHKELAGPTTHRKLTSYRPHPPQGPIQLQDHGNPVRYRNIWVRRLGDYDATRKAGWAGAIDEASFKALHELKEGAAPQLHGEAVEVAGMNSYLSLPQGDGPHPGVVVIHEWWGLNDHVKHWADRLAADGYAALAVDLYGGTVATTRDAAMEAMQSVDAEDARTKLRAAHSFLQRDVRVRAPKTGCIGWCFGGAWSLRLAIAEPELDAAVIYYGRLITDSAELGAIRAPVLGIFGNQDRSIPPRAVDAFAEAMERAGRKLELQRYDANHAFANPSSARYDAASAEAAWAQTRRFLRENLKK